jgi:hypothetical protein
MTEVDTRSAAREGIGRRFYPAASSLYAIDEIVSDFTFVKSLIDGRLASLVSCDSGNGIC